MTYERCSPLGLLIGVATLLLTTGVSLGEAESATSIPLPAKAVGFAISPEAGTFVVVSETGTLTLYPKLLFDRTLDGAVVEKTAATFGSVAHKRVAGAASGFFVAVSTNDKTLRVFDDRSLTPLKTIPLGIDKPGTLAASRSERDPYVVCADARSDFAPTSFPHRYNLKTFTDDGPIDIGREQVGEIAVSGDGSKLYGRSRAVSPSGVRCWRIEPAATPQKGFVGLILHSEHNTLPTYVPDALGQFVACGKTLFSADMRQTMIELPATPVCFLADRPLFFGLDGDALTAFSYNTFKSVGTLTLPSPQGVTPEVPTRARSGRAPTRAATARRPRNDSNAQTGIVLDDSKRHALVVCSDSRVIIVPLTALSLPSEPFLYATVEGSTSVSVDQPAQIKLTTVDPRAKVELVNGPAGLKLQSDLLVWSPAAADVGTAKVQIRISAAGIERTQDVELVVRRPFVSLPFEADQMRLSNDGKSILLLRTTPEEPRNGRNMAQNPPPFARVAVVSLGAVNAATGVPAATLVERTLTATLGHQVASLDDKFVYLPLQDSDAFLVLSVKDLSDVKRIFAPGRATRLNSAGGMLYVSTRTPGGNGLDGPHSVLFKLPGFEPSAAASSGPALMGFFENPPGLVVPYQTAEGWLFEGALYDANMVKPRLLLEGQGFIVSNTVRARANNGLPNQNNAPPISPWGAYLQGLSLLRISGQTVAHFAVSNSTGGMPGEYASSGNVLPDVPAAAVLAVTTKRSRPPVQNGSTEHAEVSFHDLQSGASAGSVVLSDEPQAEGPNWSPRQSHSFLDATRGLIFAMVDQRMFLLPTSGPHAVVNAASLPVPLHFVYQQSAFAIDGDKPTILAHVIAGGSAPVQFALSAQAPGIDISPSTGAVTIDGKSVAARVVDEVYANLLNQYRPPAAPQQSPPSATGIFEGSAAFYLKSAGPRFAKLAGHAARGLPVAIELGIVARDQNQQVAVLNEVVLLDLPREALLAKAKTQEADDPKRQATLRTAPPNGARPFPTSQAVNPPGSVTAMQQRIDQLERENSRLHAQVDLLTDLVRGGARSPTTQAR